MQPPCHNDRGGVSEPLWYAGVKTAAYKPLAKDITVDVGIVGAGIAGLTAAYLLAKDGKSVAVLDDGPISGGESGRTTAHITAALDDGYAVLHKHHGANRTKMAAESHTAAIDLIEKIVKDEAIDCDFARVDGYLFLGPETDEQDLDIELQAAKEAGLTALRKLANAPLQSFDTGPCLHYPGQGQFHILQYLQGLAAAIEGLGGTIFTGSHVTEVEGGNTAHLTTADGHTVHCRHVVVATNAPINDNALIYGRQAPYRTFVIGMTIPKGSVEAVLLWDTADPYHYVRVQEGKTQDFLIVGGEDHKTGQQDDAGLRFSRLEKWARKRFPMAEDIAYRWSGQVMEPSDGMAFIGRKPMDADNVYIITGDSGNGMTHGTIGGMLITDLIAGRKNPWEELYDPRRSPLKGMAESMKENMNVAGQMTEWLKPGDASSTEDIAPESGRIIRSGATKLAIYRDKDGTLHTMSAICPHKGCIVAWNSFEKSWDCPCHGSRFDACGHVLNGPTLADLQRVAARSDTKK